MYKHNRAHDISAQRRNPDSTKNLQSERSSNFSRRPRRLLSAMGSVSLEGPRLGCFTTAGPTNLATFASLSWRALKRSLTVALNNIARDFRSLKGIIIDIRDNPGGEDSIAITIINRFCDHKRVAFHRKTKIGPGKHDFTPL